MAVERNEAASSVRGTGTCFIVVSAVLSLVSFIVDFKAAVLFVLAFGYLFSKNLLMTSPPFAHLCLPRSFSIFVCLFSSRARKRKKRSWLLLATS